MKIHSLIKSTYIGKQPPLLEEEKITSGTTGISLIEVSNNIGPKKEPCGIPKVGILRKKLCVFLAVLMMRMGC